MNHFSLHTVNEKRHLMLLNMGYSELNANWNWRDVCSPFVRIFYVKSGSAQTTINDVKYYLEPGNLYLIPPFSLHHYFCDSEFSLYYIHFYENAINELSIFDVLDFPFAIGATKLDELLVERLLEINPDIELEFYDPSIYDNAFTFSKTMSQSEKLSIELILENEGILSQLFSRFIGEASEKMITNDCRLSRVFQYIHENLNKNISIDVLSDIACMSRDHLIRLFKVEFGTTPLQYINSRKIEQAQMSLLTTNKSVRDIALDLAIDNISYFNRIFKRKLGMSPSEYRKESV